MPIVLPVSEMQRNSAALVNEAIETKEPIYLTRRGRSAVVVMDAEEFDRRMTLQRDIYRHEMDVRDGIERGHEQIAAGRTRPLDEVLASIDERLAR